MESLKYIGCDVGKMGGIVILDIDGNILQKHTMPMIGKEYDTNAIRDIFCTPGIGHIAIEDVHAVHTGGRSSNFSFGYGKAILIGIATGLFIPMTLVQAKTWQKEVWHGVTKQKNTKDTSLIAAKRLFPNETFLASDRSRKPHDGLVDATLIAEYIRRKLIKK